MLFNSPAFVVFFMVVVGLYFALPHRVRWALLLAASYYFYACWEVRYLGLIVASTLVDYLAGLWMGSVETRRARTPALVVSLAINLGLLFTFKYFNFLSRSAELFLSRFNLVGDFPALKVLLPVGISFYTFQTLSYAIDVYRGVRKPERHLGIFAVYVAFFPQLVAGPIERSTRLLPQFFQKHNWDVQRAWDGVLLMLWGLALKVAVADRLAVLVDQAYGAPADHRGWPLILATYFCAFQIYCDFAGYSAIAIGAAQVLGFRLMENFRQPYLAGSLREFWSRWHISLSSWFRDYLYIPLGGNRVRWSRWCFNIAVVFLLSGLWHGANWTFLLWGGLHGFYLLAERGTLGLRRRIAGGLRLDAFPLLTRAVQVVVTFHLVLVAWVLFRADSLGHAWEVFSSMFRWRGLGLPLVSVDELAEYRLCVVLVALLMVADVLQSRGGVRQWLARQAAPVRWAASYLLIVGLLFLGRFESVPFVYFQF